MLGLNLSLGLGSLDWRTLTQRALAAIRRAGGTVLAAGAATPVLGQELCSDGGFNIGVADWASASGVHTWTGSALRRATGQGDGGSYRDFVVVPNQEYLVYTAMYNLVGTGNARVFAYGGGGFTGLVGTLTASGYMWVRPTSANLRLYLYTDNTRGADFDDVSVKLFSGYTYGNPPVRNFFDSAGTDILDSVTQVDQPVGLTLDAAGTAVPILTTTFASYLATITSTSLPSTATNTGTSNYGFQIASVYTSGKVYEYTVSWSGNTARRNLSVDGYGSSSFSNAESGTATFTLKQGGANLYVYAMSAPAGESFTLNSIIVRELTGNHATQATTGSKPTLRRDANGRYYWQFDPAAPGDFFNMAAPMWSGTDDHCVVVGMTPGVTTNNNRTLFAQHDFSTTNTSFVPLVGIDGSTGRARVTWRNTSGMEHPVLSSGSVVGLPTVLSARRIGSAGRVKLNGTVIGNVTLAGTFNVQEGAIGFTRWNNSTTDYFNGGVSVIVLMKATVSDADLALIERWVGSLQGQTL